MAPSAPDRVAVVSDVHGNATAYRAVLDDIARRGITTIVNLGDIVGKGPRGAEATELTRRRCIASVRGNWEAYVAGPDDPFDEASAWWRAELTAGHRAWLTALPGAIDLLMSGRRIRLVHASAVDEFTRVRRDHDEAEFAGMFANTAFTADAVVLGRGSSGEASSAVSGLSGPFVMSASEAAGAPGAWALAGLEPTVVLYGDIHHAYLEIADGRTLGNVGSVGNPLDEPVAAYAVLEGVLDGGAPAPFSIRHVRLPYDVEAEIAAASVAGMPQLEPYAIELRTAIHRGRHAELGLTAP